MNIFNPQRDLANCLNHINQLVNDDKFIQARLTGALLLPFIELENCINYAFKTLNNLPIAVIKLPISFVACATEKPLFKILHTDLLPGVTDVCLTAFKACICFFNILFVPIMTLLSPKVCIKYHESYGLHSPVKQLLNIPNNFITKKSFKDIVGMDALKQELTLAIQSFKTPQVFDGYDIHRSNGIIFYGDPGCGKSLVAKCLAGEMNLPFKKYSVGDFTSIYKDSSVTAIHKMFEDVKQAGGGVVFIDEIESLVKDRKSDSNSFSSSLENDKVISEMLVQLENASSHNILVIAATNHLDSIDPAILRPGRFDQKIKIPSPDIACIKGLLEHYLQKNKKLDLLEDEQYQQFAEKLEGVSVSDVQMVVRSAALLAFKEQVNINATHVHASIDHFLNLQKEQLVKA